MDTKKLFQEAKEAGIDEIEVYTVRHAETQMSVFAHQIDTITSSDTTVSYVRGAYMGHIGAIYLENLEMDNQEIIQRIKSNAKNINVEEPYFIYEGDKEYPTLPPFEGDFEKHTLAEKKALALKLAELIEAEHELVDSCPSASYEEYAQECTIVNSNGLNVSKKSAKAYLIAEVVAKKGEDVKSGFDVQVAKKWADLNPEVLAKTAVEATVSQLGAEPIQSGDYKVLIKNSAMRSLLSAYSSVFSAEMAIRKMSFLEGKENTKVFGDNITIIDDPLCNLAPSVDSFDDEGVGSYAKTVVDHGVFKTFLHNLKTAKMMQTKTTANGYKNGVSGKVGVSPSNFYIAPGDKDFDTLVTECQNGFYLTEVTGLHAGINVINGDFSLQSKGFEIKDGKIGKPVNLIVVSGNIKTLLGSVLAIGNDLEFKYVKIGAPSLLVEKLSISGK